jgi:ABC-2 type transport system ATP-binding protein
MTAIEIEGLVKRYGDHPAVDGISLEVDEGETFGYLGPNGAGKTTTIRCVLGLIAPSAGRIRVLGHDVGTDLASALGEIGYLPGEFSLWPQLTGRECLVYLGSLHPRTPARLEELLDRFELAARDLDRHVREYSRGMKQKVGIVQAFQHEPRLVVLDEPTEGLDPLMKERFIELLAEHAEAGRTAFLSSHILSEVEEATTRVGVLRAGRLVKVGPTEDLRGGGLRECTLVLKEPLSNPSVLDLPGVQDLRAEVGSEDRRFRFRFGGDMEPLLRVLAGLRVEEFLCEPLHLTEAFFEVYEAGEAGEAGEH